METINAVKALAALMNATHNEDEQVPSGRYTNPAKPPSPHLRARRKARRKAAKLARRRNRWA